MTLASTIKFGTDGWRGVIADDFTFENVARVALAAAHFFKKEQNIRNGVVVGYDSRFLSKEFAEKTAEVLGNKGIKVMISNTISSTPMVSLLAKKLNMAGGIVITASHNPAKYNGFKLKGFFGGPAHPEMVERLEKELKKIPKGRVETKKSFAQLLESGIIVKRDFTDAYVADLSGKLNLGLIKSSNIKIAYDAIYGAGQGVVEKLVTPRLLLRSSFNPSFDNAHPEPLPQNLRQLMSEVVAHGCDIGIATDGDADRVGAVDEKGNFVDSHRIFAILLKYLVETKKWHGEVAKSFSVSEIINKMCAKYGLTLHETAIGFKHLCRLMTERDILIAAEESGGLGVKGHIPERDGIYVGLLLCEIMAVRRKKLSELVDELMKEFGPHYFNRIDSHLTEKEKKRVLGVFAKGVKSIGKYRVLREDRKDGIKLFVDKGWVLVRASGTEPLIRYYAEADSPERVNELLKEVTSF